MSVKIFDLNIPKNTNLQIIELLANHHWFKGQDNKENRLHDLNQGINRGLSVETYHCHYPDTQDLNTPLNLFANLIYQMTLKKLEINGVLFRFYWNLYTPGDTTNLHTDMDNNNFYSIIYNLHTTDGFTLIDGQKYEDLESHVKVFNSNLLHKGSAPKNSKFRMNLNIVFKPIK